MVVNLMIHIYPDTERSHLRQILAILIFLASAIDVSGQTSIRFFGNGINAPDADRIKIRIDDENNNDPGPPADIGAEDFTLEFWMKASAADNNAAAVSCGFNINWIYGNIIIDRDRYNQSQKFGISIAGGTIVFGVSGDYDQTICGTAQVLDDTWHHVAVQRRHSDGYLWMFIDGTLQDTTDGPDGDISYPDNGVPCSTCCSGNNCNFSDPFIVLGAEKHDAGAAFPSYNGYMDELRFSNTLRYFSDFSPSSTPFNTDINTVALYHFDENCGDTLYDDSQAVGGPSPGLIKTGGTPEGPLWSNDTPFLCAPVAKSWSAAVSEGWMQHPRNWQANGCPTLCNDVIIPSGTTIQIQTGPTAVARTLHIELGSMFSMDAGTELQIGN